MKTAIGAASPDDRGNKGPAGYDWYTSHRPMKGDENQSTLFPVTAPKIQKYGSYGPDDSTEVTEDRQQRQGMIRGFLPTAPAGSSRYHSRLPAPYLIGEDAKDVQSGQGTLWKDAKSAQAEMWHETRKSSGPANKDKGY